MWLWLPVDRSLSLMKVLIEKTLGGDIEHASIVSIIKVALLARQHTSLARAKGVHSVLLDGATSFSSILKLVEDGINGGEVSLLKRLSHGCAGGREDAPPQTEGPGESPPIIFGSTTHPNEYYEWGSMGSSDSNAALSCQICLSVVVYAFATHAGYVLPYHHWIQDATRLHCAGAERRMCVNSSLFLYVCNERKLETQRRGIIILKVHALDKSAVIYTGKVCTAQSARGAGTPVPEDLVH